ncbi:MAG: peptide deformylase [Peptococcaceae bacterium]|nr:peptide deformylase [Peptococcaceae bacterium]
MPVREVLLLGNPLLRQKSQEVRDFSDAGFKQAQQDLKDTLPYLQSKYDIGRALAAPQIGHFLRLIYFRYDGHEYFMVNPRIVGHSARTFHVWDSCFSFGVAFFVNIKRWYEVTVEYFTPERDKKVVAVQGDTAELWQHEIDHLDGILATDHLEDPRQNIIMRQEWEKSGLKGGRRQPLIQYRNERGNF